MWIKTDIRNFPRTCAFMIGLWSHLWDSTSPEARGLAVLAQPRQGYDWDLNAFVRDPLEHICYIRYSGISHSYGVARKKTNLVKFTCIYAVKENSCKNSLLCSEYDGNCSNLQSYSLVLNITTSLLCIQYFVSENNCSQFINIRMKCKRKFIISM